jgi:hypothetical protein
LKRTIKKQTMKKLLFPIAIILFAFTSCQKDISSEGMPSVIGTPKFAPAPVTASVSGVVVNENNVPVVNAQVMIRSTVYTTDANGYFKSGSLTLDKNISTVKVTMNGYFTAYRSFSATEARNYIMIKLVPKSIASSFESTGGGTINCSGGGSCVFPSNAIVIKATGAPYTGTVNVYSKYIDPTADDFGAQVPGSLMAEDLNNFYVLRSTGMMAVEMESPSGVALQVAPGKSVAMKMPIPASLLSKAPSTIDTWSLDDRGIWIKEGTAIRSGNAYDFQVTHFSFWNCDVPTTAVHLNINVKDQNGNNMVNTWVSLTSSTTWGTTYGLTDSLGNVSGMIPKDEALELKVFAGYACSAGYYNQNIGPYSSNASVNIVAPIPVLNSVIVSGTAINCAGAPVMNGTVHLYIGYLHYFLNVSNGTFSDTIPSCSTISTLYAVVIDNGAGQQSSPVSVTVSGGLANLGTVTACGISTDEFITYVLDGTTFSITSSEPTSTFYGNVSTSTTGIGAFGNLSQINFGVIGGSVGTFPVSSDSLFVNAIYGIPLSTGTTTFTAFGVVGEFLEGNFNIPFEATGSVHTLTGTFRIRRDF